MPRALRVAGRGVARACAPRARWSTSPSTTGGAGDLRLGEEFHHNGLSIRCAQIGRVPRGLAPLWTRERLQAETLDLLRSHGDVLRQVLVSDELPFDDAPAFLCDVVERRRHALLAVLDLEGGAV